MYTMIVAGGDGKRMGMDKAVLPCHGTTMALYLAEKYSVLGPVGFSVGSPGSLDTGNYPAYVDPFPGCGPLNGLITAFANTDADFVFLASIDMPCMDPALVLRLRELCEGHDACVAVKPDGSIEGFCGVYSRDCDYLVDDVMRVGRNTFDGLLFQLDVRYVRAEDLPGFDLGRCTRRILTPGDYEELKQERMWTP